MTPDAMAALHARAMTTPRPWTGAEFGALLATPGTFAVGDDAGFALGRVVLDEAELLTLAVDPARWRQGIGRSRLAGFEQQAHALGAALAHLEVACHNLPAIALYTAAGWTEAGRRRGYYRTPDGGTEDALLFRKILAPA